MTRKCDGRGGHTVRPARALAASAFAAVVLVSAVGNASANDPKAGRKQAAKCQVCHGYDGLGKNPEVPHIAGESDIYLIRQLRAFRSGKRTHPQMSIVAKGLSDQDISDLAAYYAAIKLTVEVPDY